MNLKENYQDKILAIWENPKFKEFTGLHPEIVETLEPNKGLLFIGLNPSIKKLEEAKYSREVKTFPAPSPKDTYYSEFYKIAEESGFKDNWQHLDILFFKALPGNAQKLFKSEAANIKSFFEEQLKISKEILDLLKPKVIVVANKFACQLMGKPKELDLEQEAFLDLENLPKTESLMNLEFEPMEDYYQYHGIPVIFSVQLNKFCKDSYKKSLAFKIKKFSRK